MGLPHRWEANLHTKHHEWGVHKCLTVLRHPQFSSNQCIIDSSDAVFATIIGSVTLDQLHIHFSSFLPTHSIIGVAVTSGVILHCPQISDSDDPKIKSWRLKVGVVQSSFGATARACTKITPFLFVHHANCVLTSQFWSPGDASNNNKEEEEDSDLTE